MNTVFQLSLESTHNGIAQHDSTLFGKEETAKKALHEEIQKTISLYENDYQVPYESDICEDKNFAEFWTEDEEHHDYIELSIEIVH